MFSGKRNLFLVNYDGLPFSYFEIFTQKAPCGSRCFSNACLILFAFQGEDEDDGEDADEDDGATGAQCVVVRKREARNDEGRGEGNCDEKRLLETRGESQCAGDGNHHHARDEECPDNFRRDGDGHSGEDRKDEREHIAADVHEFCSFLVERIDHKLGIKIKIEKHDGDGEDENEHSLAGRDGDDRAEEILVKTPRARNESGEHAREAHAKTHDECNREFLIACNAPAEPFDRESRKNRDDDGAGDGIDAHEKARGNTGERNMGERVADHGEPFEDHDKPESR